MEVPYRSNDETANEPSEFGSSDLAYSREEMLIIKETALARERPSFLSIEFNDEKGLFAPDKWFDHTFAQDTHKSVSAGRKKILNRGEEELGLSPQRRQFAGGCVPGSAQNNKEQQGNSKVWRNGKAGNTRDDNKNESQNNRWKQNNKDNNDKQNRHRPHVFSHNTDELPEWMESKVSVNDVIELKGFDGSNSDTKKLKDPPLTMPKFDEMQLLKEIQRSDSSSNETGGTSGSRFISFFKRNQENQQQQQQPSPPQKQEPISQKSEQSNLMNNLFGANQSWPEMPATAGILASDIESRMKTMDVKESGPELLPELSDAILHPLTVQNSHRHTAPPPSFDSSWEDDLIKSLLPKHDVYIGGGRSENNKDVKMPHEESSPVRNNLPEDIINSLTRENNHHASDAIIQPLWDRNTSSDFMSKKLTNIENDDRLDDIMVHGLQRTPDLSHFAADFSKHESTQSISPPRQPPPAHFFADSAAASIPPPPSSRSPPLHPSNPMLSAYGRMPSPFQQNMPPMPNNGMPPHMMPFPFPYHFPYPSSMMNPQHPMGPNGMSNNVPHPHPSTSTSSSSAATPGQNLPTSVLLRMKSQQNASQRQSPDSGRRENNAASPQILEAPHSSNNYREGSISGASDNESNSNGQSNNMFPRNNFDPNNFYNMMLMQSMMNMPMPGMAGMPPHFPPNMAGFPGMMPPPPPGMHHPQQRPPYGAPLPPHFPPPGMSPFPSHENNGGPQSISPMMMMPEINPTEQHRQQHHQQQQDIPESILRKLPTSAKPLTVADLERNLFSKN